MLFKLEIMVILKKVQSVLHRQIIKILLKNTLGFFFAMTTKIFYKIKHTQKAVWIINN